MNRTRNFLEDYIEGMYKSIGIRTPEQLNIESVATQLKITVLFVPRFPMQSGKTIVLDSRLSDAQKWQDFTHELCHVLWHGVNQRVMNKLYLDYQEWKAESFALHACVPSFMLEKMDLPINEKEAVWEIHETFNVELSFAEERLDKWLQQRDGFIFQQKIMKELS